MKESVRQLLAANDQDHLIRHYENLPDRKRQAFLDDLKEDEIRLVFRLYQDYNNRLQRKPLATPAPPEAFTLPKTPQERGLCEKARIRGEALIREQKVAVLVAAGGQGSRLSFEGPKGTYPISPVKNKSLFRLFAEQVRAISLRYRSGIPFLVMTSEENHDDTVQFFRSHDLFGLDPRSLHFFTQGMLPTLTPKGKLFLRDETHLYRNPDGHGGSLKALHQSGLLDLLLNEGYRQLFYYQIDNPLVKIADPVFLGYHLMRGAEISTKVVRRRDVSEKVGVYLSLGGKDAIVEYTDLDAHYMKALDGEGKILFWAGNTAIHCISLPFIRRLNEGGFAVPYHCAKKPFEFVNLKGTSTTKTCWKFESFIFDAIPLARKTCCMEVLREREFSPVKNREGKDSPETARRDMVTLFRNWCIAAGLTLPPDAKVEVSPLFALDEEEFLGKVQGRGLTLQGDLYIE